jgi:hypothetical protein
VGDRGLVDPKKEEANQLLKPSVQTEANHAPPKSKFTAVANFRRHTYSLWIRTEKAIINDSNHNIGAFY